MKKYSLIKRESYRRISLIKLALLIIIILGVLTLTILSVPRILTGAVQMFWLPFDDLRVWMTESSGSFPQYFRDRKALLFELDQLRVQLSTNQANENTINKLQAENQDFRTLLNSVPAERFLARVVARPNQLPYDQLLIDLGSNQGVLENAPVFLEKDQVIGIVTKVNNDTSLVTLISTPNFIATAYIIGPNIYTYTEGMGGGIIRITVPPGVPLQRGNLVILPAIDSGVYGTVSEISTSPTQPEQYGYVSPGASLQSLKYLTIGRTPVTPHTFAVADKLVKTITSNLLLVPVPEEKLVMPPTENASSSQTSSTVTITN